MWLDGYIIADREARESIVYHLREIGKLIEEEDRYIKCSKINWLVIMNTFFKYKVKNRCVNASKATNFGEKNISHWSDIKKRP